LDFDEPFTSLVHQGMILGTDGQKMSKSKGNTINPDDSISKYGSDVFRMFLEFAFAYTDGGPWNENGVESMARFVKRIETLIEKAQNMDSSVNEMTANEKKLDFIRNTTIGAVTKDMDVMQFNTSLARMMEYLNALNDYVSGPINKEFLMDCIKTFVLLLAPFAPHLGEELWEKLGHPYSVFNQQWPKVNESALVKDEMKIVIQTNGKLRGTFEVAKTTDKDTVIQMAKDQIKDFLQDKEIVKEIYVPGRLVNLVVK
jgi:leucyl-tRNA synthetase